MKTRINILVQMMFLLLLSHISFSQEVEVNLGGNSTSDAFVVKDTSGNVLLKMDGDKNFGINTEQPDGIEIKGRDNVTPGSVSIIGGNASYPSTNNGGSVSIIGGNGSNGVGGSINIASGYGLYDGGDVNITTGGGAFDIGNINISTSSNGNNAGGSITIATGYANTGANDIILKTGGTASIEEGNRIHIGESLIGLYGSNDITLQTGNGSALGGNILLTIGYYGGIILNPNQGLVEILGSGTYTGTWTQASDERYKSNIKSLPGILNRVKMLQPVEYEWNKEEFPENNFPDGNQIGLIAQEVEKLFPEIIATNQDGYKSIDYSKISVLLIQAMKEQQNEIEKQSDEIKKQSDEINKMKSDIEELKSMIMQDSNKFSLNENQKEVN